jgi:hypothetical protein
MSPVATTDGPAVSCYGNPTILSDSARGWHGRSHNISDTFDYITFPFDTCFPWHKRAKEPRYTQQMWGYYEEAFAVFLGHSVT